VSDDFATDPGLVERTLEAARELQPRLVIAGAAAPVVRCLVEAEDLPAVASLLHRRLFEETAPEVPASPEAEAAREAATRGAVTLETAAAEPVSDEKAARVAVTLATAAANPATHESTAPTAPTAGEAAREAVTLATAAADPESYEAPAPAAAAETTGGAG
jgi:hypothetical protein